MRFTRSSSALVLTSLALAIGAFTGSAAAQLSPTLMEGDPFPGLPGVPMLNIRGSAGNHVGDWAVRVYTGTVSNNDQRIWGSIGGAAPTLLRTLGVVGSYDQLGFTATTDPFGLADDGRLIYSALVNELLGPGVGLDSL